MTYLIVVAHPDDEVLGAGASIRQWTMKGGDVHVCIMNSSVEARSMRPDNTEIDCDIRVCSEFLGISRIYKGHFPNIEMNTVPHIRLVRFIEEAILDSRPDVIITHHPSDTNNDHLHTSLACQEASRISQRRPGVKAPSELWYMEVPSSTDWSLNTSMNRFQPNTYVEIGKDGIAAKIEALGKYRNVMRPFPHSRSKEAITGLAAYRGAQSGIEYAEAFECVLRRL